MGQGEEAVVSLSEACRAFAESAPRVEVLLARYFPAAGGNLYPDAAGNVCVAESPGRASDRPASVYARSVSKLTPLVAAFSAAAMEQAATACIRVAKERTVFACALDFARHPWDPMQRQLFVARMMPQPTPLFRQDDATASCIWLRLWTLHAWVLELRLAIALAGVAPVSDHALLTALDRQLSCLLRPNAQWLTVDLEPVTSAEMVARAPGDALAVGNLVAPARLGALVPACDLAQPRLHRAGVGLRQQDGRASLRFGTRCVEMPATEKSLVPSPGEVLLPA
jgi:hypothetical protein